MGNKQKADALLWSRLQAKMREMKASGASRSVVLKLIMEAIDDHCDGTLDDLTWAAGAREITRRVADEVYGKGG